MCKFNKKKNTLFLQMADPSHLQAPSLEPRLLVSAPTLYPILYVFPANNKNTSYYLSAIGSGIQDRNHVLK
jgi:hypothetical protein